jgi:hypothetical protein
VIRIVECVDDDVRGAWIIGILLKYRESDPCRQRLPPEAFVSGAYGAEQR